MKYQIVPALPEQYIAYVSVPADGKAEVHLDPVVAYQIDNEDDSPWVRFYVTATGGPVETEVFTPWLQGVGVKGKFLYHRSTDQYLDMEFSATGREELIESARYWLDFHASQGESSAASN